MFLKLVHLSSKSFNILYFNSQDKMTLKKLKNNPSKAFVLFNIFKLCFIKCFYHIFAFYKSGNSWKGCKVERISIS